MTESAPGLFVITWEDFTMTTQFPKLQPTRQRQYWLRVAVVVGLCSVAAALPRLMSPAERTSFVQMAISLEAMTTLPSLRLPVSLPTGTQITPPLGTGYSQLTVRNGNPVDAVVKLVDTASGQTLRFVYVQANEDITLDDLSPCTCDLRFATGIDWDAEQQTFRRNVSRLAFTEPLRFVVQRDASSETWTTVEVTLHPVLGGTAQAETLDEDEF